MVQAVREALTKISGLGQMRRIRHIVSEGMALAASLPTQAGGRMLGNVNETPWGGFPRPNWSFLSREEGIGGSA